jgi:hypothetical protein
VISTVTTSTVSTITTVALAGSVALIGILVLLALLVQKEIAGSDERGRYQRLGRALNIGIIPLLFAFILIVVVKVIEIVK